MKRSWPGNDARYCSFALWKRINLVTWMPSFVHKLYWKRRKCYLCVKIKFLIKVFYGIPLHIVAQASVQFFLPRFNLNCIVNRGNVLEQKSHLPSTKAIHFPRFATNVRLQSKHVVAIQSCFIAIPMRNALSRTTPGEANNGRARYLFPSGLTNGVRNEAAGRYRR